VKTKMLRGGGGKLTIMAMPDTAASASPKPGRIKRIAVIHVIKRFSISFFSISAPA
jgi:hypothetical protein